MDREFPTTLASKLTGISIGALDNWDRRGILKASVKPAGGHGVSRIYSIRDLVAISVIATLRAEQLPLRVLQRVAAFISGHTGGLSLEALAETNIITDGHDVHAVQGDVYSLEPYRRPGRNMLLVFRIGSFLDSLLDRLAEFGLTDRAA